MALDQPDIWQIGAPLKVFGDGVEVDKEAWEQKDWDGRDWTYECGNLKLQKTSMCVKAGDLNLEVHVHNLMEFY